MVKSLPYLTHLDSLSAILKAFRLTVPSAIYTATSKKFGAKGLAALEGDLTVIVIPPVRFF
jgi:hypothetical protein